MPIDDLSLNARWRMTSFDEGAGEAEGAHRPDYDDSGWMDAVVPGDVHLDLMRASAAAEDPFVGLNHLESRWIENREWWYRREFLVPEGFRGRRIELRFRGLDTFAAVWVNGECAGTHDNMFIPCTLDVTQLIRRGHRNSVAVRLSSPIKAVEDKPTGGMVAAFETCERLHARKAQMSYGWDIAPRIVTTGIWRPVYLVARGEVEIGDVAVRTEAIESNAASISLEIPLRRNSPDAREAELRVEIRSAHRGDPVIAKSKSVSLRGAQTVGMKLRIPNPRLWWPWNVGHPDLYRLSVKVLVGGRVSEEYDTGFGVRTVELLQEPQEDGGASFIFSVNGERVFAKGTNWIPGDAIFARMTRKKYRDLISLAVAQNVNMLRIWGGGIYEDPYFYRLCDEHGIMVWQDFMFTCAEYPQDEEFLRDVRREAESVVSSLRNHPSIVLWCGDNEVDATRRWSGREFRQNRINREALPEVCARLDPTRPYIPSSPFSPSDPADPLRQDEGDNHIWHHGTSYKADVYAKDESRFVSEIGHLSLPWPESIRRFITEESVWPPENRVWDFHFGTVERLDPRRRERLDEAISAFGVPRPENLEEYAYTSQLVQALAYKEWIEHCRRRKPLCGGILYWNLYDNWPQFSDAVVDHYGVPKMAYYFVRRAFSNLLVSLQDLESGMVGVWLVSDDPSDRVGKLLLRCQRLDGGTSWTRVLPVLLPANSSRMVWDMRLPRPLMTDPCGCFAQAQLLVGGRVVSEGFYFPVECVEMNWPETELSARVISVRGPVNGFSAEIAVASKLYGRLVRIETPGRESVFSDNFFDIPPDEERIVRVSSHGEVSRLRLSALNAPTPIEVSV